MVSTNFLAQKTIEKKIKFSIFWFQEMSLKREIFVNYFCVSENFNMSPVSPSVAFGRGTILNFDG